jgi:hypothetical protein
VPVACSQVRCCLPTSSSHAFCMLFVSPFLLPSSPCAGLAFSGSLCDFSLLLLPAIQNKPLSCRSVASFFFLCTVWLEENAQRPTCSIGTAHTRSTPFLRDGASGTRIVRRVAGNSIYALGIATAGGYGCLLVLLLLFFPQFGSLAWKTTSCALVAWSGAAWTLTGLFAA